MPAKTTVVLVVSAAALMLVYAYGPGPGGSKPAAVQAPKAGRSLSSYFNLAAGNASAPAVAIDAPSLSARLERLAASGTADDAYAAYSLLDDCIVFQAEGRLPSLEFERGSEMTAEEKAAETQLCAGMTQRQKNSRLDFLASAAKGGVNGASSHLLWEGPFGDPHALHDRADDPLVREWRQQVITLLRERADDGELIAINTLMSAYLNGGDLVQKDPLLAYGYISAMRQAIDDMMVPGDINPYVDEYWNWLRDQLTPEQQAAALAKGNSMAAKYRQHTGHPAHS